MSYRLDVSVGFSGELERLLALNADNAATLFPNQIEAIKRLALLAQKKWIDYASGKPLPDGSTINRWSGSYARSIQIEHDGELRYTVFSDDIKALLIENGGGAWDMKKLLYTSHKTRISKDGGRYLIWPFRKGSPNTTVLGEYTGGDMPVMVNQWWLSKDQPSDSSEVTGQFSEKSAQDGSTKVQRNTYRWGSRLSAKDLESVGLDPEREGKNLLGMVRMRSPDGGNSQLTTFRVMSESSSGWQVPDREAKAPAKAVYDFLSEHFERVMGIALEADIEALKRRL